MRTDTARPPAPRRRELARAQGIYVFDVEPTAARARRHARSKALKEIGHGAVAVALAAVLVAVLGLVVGPAVLGYRASVMSGDGMDGSIDRGDVVISVPRPVADVRYGDIITFHAPVADHHLVTHRVVGVEHRPDGRVVVSTRGDGNPVPDPWTTTLPGDTVWQTRYVVPELGHLVTVAKAATARYGAMWVALIGIVALALSLVWRRQPAGPTGPAPRVGVVERVGRVEQVARSQRPRLTLITSEAPR